MIDWDDIRHFLAVARAGSTLGAGRALGVSQTTAARRVATLEARLGLTLFERRQAGYALTEHGAALLPRAEAMEVEALALGAAAAGLGREVRGSVRLSAQLLIATTVLPPLLRDLHTAHPAIMLELDASDAMRDLARGEADIALRVGNPSDAGLVGRRLGDDAWTVYCSRDYAAVHGRPTRRSELAGHDFIAGGEPKVWEYYRVWLVANGLEAAVTMHHSSSSGLLSAVRAGAGLAALPCFVADQDPALVRCLPPVRDAGERGIWLLTHERLRAVRRVRAVMDFLAPPLAALARTATG